MPGHLENVSRIHYIQTYPGYTTFQQLCENTDMPISDRIKRYKTTGAGAGLARVEVLVPPEGREQILKLARDLRVTHRIAKWSKSKRSSSEMVNDRAKLLMHRIVARRIAEMPELIDMAKEALGIKTEQGPDYVGLWQALLELDGNELRRRLTARSDHMTRLRLSSPFAHVLDFRDPQLRLRIWKKARMGLEMAEMRSSNG